MTKPIHRYEDVTRWSILVTSVVWVKKRKFGISRADNVQITTVLT